MVDHIYKPTPIVISSDNLTYEPRSGSIWIIFTDLIYYQDITEWYSQ